MAEAKKPVGRPRTVMTAEAKAKIVNTVRLGMYPDRAAAMHGVSAGTMRNERRRDPAFATALKEAEAAAEESTLSRIFRHMETQWTACAWMLERRWPERWAKREAPSVVIRDDARRLLAQVQAMREVSQAPKPDTEGTA